MKNEWWIIDGVLFKNPNQEQLKVEKHKKIAVRESVMNIITEQWWVDLNNPTPSLLDYSYNPDFIQGNLLSLERQNYFKKHDIQPLWLRAIYLPKSYFTENRVRLPSIVG